MLPRTTDSDSPDNDRTVPGPAAAVRWTVRVLALVALLGSSYLAWLSLLAGPDALLGCADLPYFDCEHVLSSPWSYWLGIPVSVFAVGVYAVILTASVLIGPTRRSAVARVAWGVLKPLAAMAAGAAAWFLGLMLFAIGDLCLQCLIVHVCGLTIAGLVIGPEVSRLPLVWHRKRSRLQRPAALGALAGVRRQEAPPAAVSTKNVLPGGRWAAALGLLGVGALIAGQVLFPAKQ